MLHFASEGGENEDEMKWRSVEGHLLHQNKGESSGRGAYGNAAHDGLHSSKHSALNFEITPSQNSECIRGFDRPS